MAIVHCIAQSFRTGVLGDTNMPLLQDLWLVGLLSWQVRRHAAAEQGAASVFQRFEAIGYAARVEVQVIPKITGVPNFISIRASVAKVNVSS